MKRALLGITGVLSAALLAGPALGSSDWPFQAKWAVRKPAYDRIGATAMIAPANDTRINLALLLADRGAPLVGRPQNVPLFAWSDIDRGLNPPVAQDETHDSDADSHSRCQTRRSGAEAFAAAVRAAGGLSEAERTALIAAREGLSSGCPDSSDAPVDLSLPEVKSQQARQFAAYIEGATGFYGGNFSAATQRFAGLANARDAWLRETALYMVGRSELNRAMRTAFDDYGYIASPSRADQAAVDAALRGFEAYLQAFPSGRYADSARGLMRRVYWLGGRQADLAHSYGELLGQPQTAGRMDLFEEIDDKLLFDTWSSAWQTTGIDKLPGFTDPRVVAVMDLWRMRKESGEWLEEGEKPAPQITRAEIEAQKEIFAKEPDLYGYVRASEALHVRGQPREVLELIPDAARQKPFGYLQFSRQVLRGLALDAVKDANARGFWLEMMQGATQPWQRETLELALAMHEERNGGLARVFAPGSEVRNPVIREILLNFVAGPDVLRKQARDASAPQREREAALYILLAKNLGHGFSADFLEDVKLVTGSARDQADGFSGAEHGSWSYDAEENANRPPLGLFVGQASLGDFGCPALDQTATALARNPQAVTPALCLADFMRLNGFDHFAYDKPLAADELAGTPSLFPGRPYVRQAVYQRVISAPAATPNEKAYALYRAVRCYAPAGSNDCGGEDVALSQRRAWFQRLKREYPQSRWAKSLSVYW